MIDLPNITVLPQGAVADGASTEMLRQLLDELSSALPDVGIDPDIVLRQGLDPEVTRSLLAAEGLGCPDELATWFSWHNGQIYEDSSGPVGPALPHFVMASLGECIENYRRQVGDHADPADRAFYIEAGGEVGWLPLATFVDGTLIDTRSGGAQAPSIRSLDINFNEYGPPYWRAESLCTLVAWWLEEIRAGTWRWDARAHFWDRDESLISTSRKAVLFAY